MDELKIEGTAKTPTIVFDGSKNELLIKGRSIPENSVDFYKPVITWLDGFDMNGNLNVNVMLEYFNTSSSKCILDVFKKLETIKTAGANVQIFWHYEEEDEDMLEAGEDYEAIIGVPFKMIEIPE